MHQRAGQTTQTAEALVSGALETVGLVGRAMGGTTTATGPQAEDSKTILVAGGVGGIRARDSEIVSLVSVTHVSSMLLKPSLQ